ncbi:G-box-binding factor 1-like [Trifolium pratense]|uniref:G-box-binding factor 1-like n=1 Tax=Trifolium pratense TaxID=57577 RepID=UPI001E690D7C|nr:G-box-binding factor 1-like [Trifolium pratense]
MGKKEESNHPFGRPYNFMVPQDQTPNNPMLPHWTTSMQSYYNLGSTPTPIFNPFPAGPYLYHQYMWPNQVQANNALLHDALHDPARLSNKPHIAEDAALAFSEVVQRNFGERNPNFNKLSRNLQPLRLTSGVSRECENQSLAPKNDRDGASTSAASGSKKSSDENQDDTDKDFPLSKKQKPDLITGDENPSGLTQNLETVVKESDADVDGDGDGDADTQLKFTEGDDIRKERKRQSNRESAKRSRMRKQQECEELCKKIDTLKDENSVLTQRLVALSEECMELTNENDSIQEELITKYGRESIEDLLDLMKPPA